MSPTQFFTPYFSNKKAVRHQPQPCGGAIWLPGSPAFWQHRLPSPPAASAPSVGGRVGAGLAGGPAEPGGAPMGQGPLFHEGRGQRALPICLSEPGPSGLPPLQGRQALLASVLPCLGCGPSPA